MFQCVECEQWFDLTPEEKLLSAIFGKHICKNCLEGIDEDGRRYAGIMVNGMPLSEYLESV